MRAVAERLAADAADFVRRRRPEVFGAAATDSGGVTAVRTKSTPTDPVTVVDTETERLLRDRLVQLRPGDAVLGEEEGGRPDLRPGATTWVVDPIDGTVNFVYGIPAYAVSVAAQINGVSIAGAVADVAAGETYSAAAGLGAQVLRSGVWVPLRCNPIDELSMALLGTGFGYAPELRARQAALVARVLPEVRDIRRIGSAALDLCMVAAGRLDIHYEHGLNVWDWAAGALIAAEAGARLLLPEPPARNGLVVAAAPGLAAEAFDLLRRFGALDGLPGVQPPG